MKEKIKRLLKGGTRTRNFLKVRTNRADHAEMLKTLGEMVADGEVEENNTGGNVYLTLKKKVQVRKKAGKTVERTSVKSTGAVGGAGSPVVSKVVQKTKENVKKTKDKPAKTGKGDDAGEGGGGK